MLHLRLIFSYILKFILFDCITKCLIISFFNLRGCFIVWFFTVISGYWGRPGLSFIPFNKIPATPLLACVMEILSASIFNYYQAFSCSVKPDTNYGSHDGRPQDCFAAGGVQT